MIDEIQPLDASIFDLAKKESMLERVMIWIPILGWMIGSGLWKRRNRPVYDSINLALESRPIINLSIWGDAQHQEIAQFVCMAVMDQIGWPNDRYLPTDDVGVIFWSFYDCLEAVEIFMKIEDRYGFKFPNELVESIGQHDMAALVDLIASLTPAEEPESSPEDLSPS